MEKQVITFKEIVRDTAKKVGMSQREVDAVLRVADEVACEKVAMVTPDMAVEVKVLPSGLSLIASHMPAHTARNPKTDEIVTVAPKNRVRAKVYSGFKNAAN